MATEIVLDSGGDDGELGGEFIKQINTEDQVSQRVRVYTTNIGYSTFYRLH